jgi:hypothetical protein
MGRMIPLSHRLFYFTFLFVDDAYFLLNLLTAFVGCVTIELAYSQILKI